MSAAAQSPIKVRDISKHRFSHHRVSLTRPLTRPISAQSRLSQLALHYLNTRPVTAPNSSMTRTPAEDFPVQTSALVEGEVLEWCTPFPPPLCLYSLENVDEPLMAKYEQMQQKYLGLLDTIGCDFAVTMLRHGRSDATAISKYIIWLPNEAVKATLKTHISLSDPLEVVVRVGHLALSSRNEKPESFLDDGMAQMGSSLGTFATRSAGTLGGYLRNRRNDELYALSCAHVVGSELLAAVPAPKDLALAKAGIVKEMSSLRDRITSRLEAGYSPDRCKGLQDLLQYKEERARNLRAFNPILGVVTNREWKFSRGESQDAGMRYMDYCLIKPNMSRVPAEPNYSTSGQIMLNEIREPKAGMEVRMFGRQTPNARGVIQCIPTTHKFSTSIGGIHESQMMKSWTIVGDVTAFSAGGDSGAIVFTEGESYAIGMLIGGQPNKRGSWDISYFTPLSLIVEDCKQKYGLDLAIA